MEFLRQHWLRTTEPRTSAGRGYAKCGPKRTRGGLVYKLHNCSGRPLRMVPKRCMTCRHSCNGRLKLRPRCGDFSIFQNDGRRHVGFLKLQISNCKTHHKCALRHRAKFPGDRSNRCRHISILLFQVGGRRHLKL